MFFVDAVMKFKFFADAVMKFNVHHLSWDTPMLKFLAQSLVVFT